MAGPRDGKMDRREFVRRSAFGALGAGLAAETLGHALGQQEAPPASPVRRGEMVYRRLGRTNLMVSELGVGGSPNPEPAVFAQALDRGMNLVDSSEAYPGSEERIAQVVAGRRDQVVICTKCYVPREEDVTGAIVAACEAALGRLKTDHIDIWCLHGLGDAAPFLTDEARAAFAQLGAAGKIRFAGASCHSTTAAAELVGSGAADVVLLALNVFSGNTVRKADVDAGKVYDNWLADSGLQAVLDQARAQDVGLIAIKTMAGGALQKLDAYQPAGTTLAQAKLKWVLSQPAISAALSEVLSYDILEENLGAVGQTLTPQEQALLEEHVRRESARVCRMCRACEQVCPAHLPIPDIVRAVTYHDRQGKYARARTSYRRHLAASGRPRCTSCGACARACPHGLRLPTVVQYAERVLG